MFARLIGQKAPMANLATGDHQPAANTAAVITLAAKANARHLVHGIQWSYGASPTGGKLTVTDGGTTIFEVDITAAGPGGHTLLLPGSVNSQVVITLAAGGAGVSGKVNAQSEVCYD